jgi:hypothetical protein
MPGRCWMLDTDTGYPGMHGGEIQKHPETSSIHDPGSRNISNDFHQDTLIARKHFMQLKGLFYFSI